MTPIKAVEKAYAKASDEWTDASWTHEYRVNGNFITTNPCPAHGLGTTGARDHMRVVGDAHIAHVETAPPGFWVEDWPPWVPALVPAKVVITEGEVTIEAADDVISPLGRKSLAADYRRGLRDAGLVVLERGRRYLTRSYATLDRREAERLAVVDGTPFAEIRAAEAVPIHAGGSWALWSDGKFTTAIGLPAWVRETKSLSRAAADLIEEARGSDSGAPAEIGGYAALAKVADYTSTPVASGAPRGHYARGRIDRLDLTLSDGGRRTIYRYTAGYPEGYAYVLEESVARLCKSAGIATSEEPSNRQEEEAWAPK